MPKKVSIVFHNGSKYNYYFIIKELTVEFKKQNTEKILKIYNLYSSNRKRRIDKNGEEITQNISYLLQFIEEKKLQKLYLTYYNLLIADDLWQAHYQILSIIFLKEFIELNVNTDKKIKNGKLVELNISIAAVFLNIQTLIEFNRIQMFVL